MALQAWMDPEETVPNDSLKLTDGSTPSLVNLIALEHGPGLLKSKSPVVNKYFQKSSNILS